MNFSLHYSVKYFKNNNCFPSILNLFYSVNSSFSERFPEKCLTFHSHVGHYKEKFECSFHSGEVTAIGREGKMSGMIRSIIQYNQTSIILSIIPWFHG